MPEPRHHPTAPTMPSPEERGRTLLALAREALEEALEVREPARPPTELPGWLTTPGATFVTLTADGSLRGCVGSMRAVRPLIEDVRDNAVAAALADSSFPPLTGTELPGTLVEVSLLSHLERLAATSEQEVLAALVPGRDGVLLEWGAHRGTFLPQVWERIPEPERFLRLLKQKARLPESFWAPDVALWTYTVEKWREADVGSPPVEGR